MDNQYLTPKQSLVKEVEKSGYNVVRIKAEKVPKWWSPSMRLTPHLKLHIQSRLDGQDVILRYLYNSGASTYEVNLPKNNPENFVMTTTGVA
jgi:hypothetical protein